MSVPAPAVPDRLLLPLRFDAAALQADLARFGPEHWVRHFNTQQFEGEWSGVAFRSVGGREGQLYPDPASTEGYADTPALARCPAVAAALAQLQCPLLSARFLKLTPGARIREHRDHRLGFADGEVRLHIPVRTHPGVAFFLAGQRVPMQQGECWYLDLNLPHRVENPGPDERVHLVVDCQVNGWLRALLLEAALRAPPPAPVEPGALQRFRELVLRTPALQQALQAVEDPKQFPERLVALGALNGCRFSVEEVQEATRAARRAWLERWL